MADSCICIVCGAFLDKGKIHNVKTGCLPEIERRIDGMFVTEGLEPRQIRKLREEVSKLKKKNNILRTMLLKNKHKEKTHANSNET